MRKKFWIPLTLIGAAAIGFFGFLPGYVEGSMNAVDGQPLIKVSDEAKALHKTLQGTARLCEALKGIARHCNVLQGTARQPDHITQGIAMRFANLFGIV
jgi:hypothetical protein